MLNVWAPLVQDVCTESGVTSVARGLAPDTADQTTRGV
jgi:hypothetical protein